MGRVPMGATPGAMEPLWDRGGEPPGDEADVRFVNPGTPVLSDKLKLADKGGEPLCARE